MIFFSAKKKQVRTTAQEIYAGLAAEAREPFFYADCRVPDTLEGRFEVLCALAAARINPLAQTDPKLAQAVFDVMFTDMDFALRQQGVGDMGVPKRVKKMMQAFHGRAKAYDTKDKSMLINAVWRNVYAPVDIAEGDPAIAAFVHRIFE